MQSGNLGERKIVTDYIAVAEESSTPALFITLVREAAACGNYRTNFRTDAGGTEQLEDQVGGAAVLVRDGTLGPPSWFKIEFGKPRRIAPEFEAKGWPAIPKIGVGTDSECRMLKQ